MDRPLVHRTVDISRDVPLGELLGEVAGHAQGILRTEVRLAFAQFREEMSEGARRTVLRAGAGVFLLLGMICVLIAGTLALSMVVAAWMAVLITGVVAFFLALLLLMAAKRSSA